MSNYLTTIGLEVHVHLKTRTKIFCGCELKYAAPPNSCVCPVCLGLPGVLPVLNKEAFLLGLRAVLSVSGTPSKRIKFDRKNYFYPDLPKGYQISQYDAPLGRGGFIEVQTPQGAKKIKLNRIHMEEDAGKLIHDQSPHGSLVDLNRAGTPLIEIVTEPDISTPQEAHDYLTSLKAILISIGVSDCDMEKGQLRCDANVSIRRQAADGLGTKVEIKNLNSFKAVKAALEYEEDRQAKALEAKEPIIQETRLWDDAKGRTHSMRSKEEAHDYRYFPEPDLVPFFVTEEEIAYEKSQIPELPQQKKERFVSQYQLSEYDAGILSADAAISACFESTVGLVKEAKVVANWMIGPIFAYLTESSRSIQETRLTPKRLAEAITLVKEGQISFQAAKDKVLPEIMQRDVAALQVIKEKGLEQVSDDSSLTVWIAEAIASNPKVVADFKAGKESSAMFLVGQVMKKSKGKANPAKVQEMVRKALKEV